MTPKHAWEDIASFIPKDKLICEAFFGDGNSARFLRELGFNVISENIDFFSHENYGDLVVSNPPFSMKKKVIERLLSLKQPFILLMPIGVLCTQYIKKVPGLQIIVPKKRIQFIKGGLGTSRCSFDCLYYCYLLTPHPDSTAS